MLIFDRFVGHTVCLYSSPDVPITIIYHCITIASESQWSSTELSTIETHAWLCWFGFSPVDQLYSCISCLAILIFSCSANGMFLKLERREQGKWSNKIIWFLIRKCSCSSLYCTDRKTWLILCWMCKYPSMFRKLPHTCWLQYDLQSEGVMWIFPLYRWGSGISVGSSLVGRRCWISVMWA